jgi:hypothetical protein
MTTASSVGKVVEVNANDHTLRVLFQGLDGSVVALAFELEEDPGS